MTALNAGLHAGWETARRVYSDPSQAYLQQQYEDHCARYNLLWSYYDNAMFDRVASWMNEYRRLYGLYKYTRAIYNPTPRAVEFYTAHLYPGVLSEDGSKLPDSVDLAIPFAEDTPPQITKAIAQTWQWSNFQAKLGLLTTYCPALGVVMLEAVDDLKRGKVLSSVIWPGHVQDLVLDDTGNVKSYALEYQTVDDDDPKRELYTYRKEVDQNEFRYYRNGDLYDYSGIGAVVPNVYGFAPATWFKHYDTGEDIGGAVVTKCISKIDELNSFVSLIHDQIAKVVKAPLAIWSSFPGNALFTEEKASTNTQDERRRDRESQVVIKGPADGRIDHLAGDLPLADCVQYMDHLIGEIEKDLPELNFYQELRSMSQVTGPAANRLSGDVASRVIKAGAGYDTQLIKHFQMLLAIGGFRANTGAWGALNAQQQLFTPFDLNSYEQGKLNFAIKPRVLITQTKTEQAQETQAFWQGVKSATDAGVPIEIVLRSEGWTDQQIQEMQKLKDEAAQRSIALMQQQAAASPANTQPQNEQKAPQAQARQQQGGQQ
jgi:hypothetical protein